MSDAKTPNARILLVLMLAAAGGGLVPRHLACSQEPVVGGGLVLIQSPTFWIVGQWTRIMIETPADCGELEVSHPQELTLLDRRPWQTGDTVQRFYFRANAPLRAGEIVFRSGERRLTLPVRVLSWAEVLAERFERGIARGEDGGQAAAAVSSRRER